MPVLEINELNVDYRVGTGVVRAVDRVSFSVEYGQNLGLLGESGCGKTTVAQAIMGSLPANASVTGEILLEGQNLLSMDPRDHRTKQWKDFSMIFQGSMNALNPVFKIGSQLADAYRTHIPASKDEARKRIEEILELVRLDKKLVHSYPHELSGGMKQRAVIAMSLLCNPKLVIADEPTTALDLITQDQILDEIKELQRKLKFSMLFISHDVSILAETCQKLCVMYAGRIFENGDVVSVLKDTRNPYTKLLLSSVLPLHTKAQQLVAIRGTPPDMSSAEFQGCRFRARCPYAQSVCEVEPNLREITQGHFSRCHFDKAE